MLLRLTSQCSDGQASSCAVEMDHRAAWWHARRVHMFGDTYAISLFLQCKSDSSVFAQSRNSDRSVRTEEYKSWLCSHKSIWSPSFAAVSVSTLNNAAEAPPLRVGLQKRCFVTQNQSRLKVAAILASSPSTFSFDTLYNVLNGVKLWGWNGKSSKLTHFLEVFPLFILSYSICLKQWAASKSEKCFSLPWSDKAV